MGPRELYVYWRTLRPQEARAACQQLQAQLRSEVPGLEARVLLREGLAAQGQGTLMEIYRHPDGIDAALELRINRQADEALAAFLASPRTVEVFLN
jgi:Domain of unknown function (DUF4936)